MSDELAWRRGHTEAYIWSCGDDECSCTIPVIERVSPNPVIGYPAIRRERLWEGAYHTQATRSERAAQIRSLRAEARRRGVPVTGT